MGMADRFVEARDFLIRHRQDYEKAYRDFQWPRLDEFNWALDYFDRMADSHDGTALWIVDEDGSQQRISFRQMARRSNRVANWLRRQEVRRGERILLMLDNVAPLWEIMLACMKLGAVVVPATVLLSGEELLDRLQRGQVRHVITQKNQAEKLRQLERDVSVILVDADSDLPNGWDDYREASQQPDSFQPVAVTRASDPLLLYFTSGTTSKPKLVLHTHESYPLGHLSTLYWIGLRPGDIHLNIASPGWAKHAWSSFFAPWNAGATVFVYRYRRFDAAKMLQAIADCRVTTLCAPPTVWRMMIQQDLASYPVSLREVVSAGEPLNPKVIEAVRSAWGLGIRDGYGQTETTALLGNPPGQPVKLGSMGRPLPGYRIRVVDEQGRDAPEGEVAIELNPRPLGLMAGYADRSGSSQGPQQGIYRTGDVASLDADGYLTFVGRSDDVFKSADYRISPFELESVLIKHPAVAESAIVPSPHPTRQTVPKAFIELKPQYQAGPRLALEILDFLRANLSPFRRVRRLEFADLPKTISGKIRRVELRLAESGERTSRRGRTEFWEEDFPGIKDKSGT